MARFISKVKLTLEAKVLRSVYFNQHLPADAFVNGSGNVVSTIKTLLSLGFVEESDGETRLTAAGEIRLFSIYNGKPRMIELEELFLDDKHNDDIKYSITKADVLAIKRRLVSEDH